MNLHNELGDWLYLRRRLERAEFTAEILGDTVRLFLIRALLVPIDFMIRMIEREIERNRNGQ